jgi:hypothetical protein
MVLLSLDVSYLVYRFIALTGQQKKMRKTSAFERDLSERIK